MESRSSGVVGASAPWNSSTDLKGNSTKSVSKYCAFHSSHCREASTKLVEIVPGAVVALCICDEHFSMLQKHVKLINETFDNLQEEIRILKGVIQNAGAAERHNPSSPNVSKALNVSEQVTAPLRKTQKTNTFIRCESKYRVDHGSTFTVVQCRRPAGHIDYNSGARHYYYSRSDTIWWDDEESVAA